MKDNKYTMIHTQLEYLLIKEETTAVNIKKSTIRTFRRCIFLPYNFNRFNMRFFSVND